MQLPACIEVVQQLCWALYQSVTKGGLGDSAQSKLQAQICVSWQRQLNGLFIAPGLQLLASFSVLNPDTKSVCLLWDRQGNLDVAGCSSYDPGHFLCLQESVGRHTYHADNMTSISFVVEKS